MAFLAFLLVICLMSGIVCGQETNNNESEKAFEEEFGIKYADPKDAKDAANELADAEAQINQHNEEFFAGNSTFYEDLNPLSNIPDDLFDQQKTGLIDPTRSFGLNRKPEHLWTTDSELLEFYNQRQTIPNEYDSTAKGWVTPAKNQMSCGSCAAFAGTSVIETCMLKAGARYNGLDLSEQFALDCGYNGDSMMGCDGAFPGEYVKWYGSSFDQGQGPHELTMPYQNANPSLTCPAATSIPIFNAGARVVSVLGDDWCNEDKLKQLVFQYGAVESVIYASDASFESYKGGVFQGCSSKSYNHAITVVGYGTENGTPYWKVKNSWGTSYGNQGYVKVLRGSGECGIGAVCTVATCASTSNPLSPIPVPPPSPPACDITESFGPGITGTYRLRYDDIESKCDCINSSCTPSVPGPTDVCMYICGQPTC